MDWWTKLKAPVVVFDEQRPHTDLVGRLGPRHLGDPLAHPRGLVLQLAVFDRPLKLVPQPDRDGADRGPQVLLGQRRDAALGTLGLQPLVLVLQPAVQQQEIQLGRGDLALLVAGFDELGWSNSAMKLSIRGLAAKPSKSLTSQSAPIARPPVAG